MVSRPYGPYGLDKLEDNYATTVFSIANFPL